MFDLNDNAIFLYSNATLTKRNLQLEDDDIKVIKKYGYRKENSFIKPNMKDLEQLRDNNKDCPRSM